MNCIAFHRLEPSVKHYTIYIASDVCIIKPYQHHLIQLRCLRNISLAQYNDHAGGVQPTTSSPACHLYVLSSQEIAHSCAVKLTSGIKDDGSGRHVDTHGKGFRRKQQLEKNQKWCKIY